jgi:hypothetical protein
LNPSENPIADDALLGSFFVMQLELFSVEMNFICIPHNPKFVAGLTDFSLNRLLKGKTVYDFSLNTAEFNSTTPEGEEPI